jgi:hypothetical protein
MTSSPEEEARVQAVESKLAELDPILRDFCTRNHFTLNIYVGVWPRRKLWARKEVDLALDLVMDLTVPEVLERGFYPEMPWSLSATASLSLPPPELCRFLTEDVFHGPPFSQLKHVLAAELDHGLVVMRRITREEIISKGKIHGQGA